MISRGQVAGLMIVRTLCDVWQIKNGYARPRPSCQPHSPQFASKEISTENPADMSVSKMSGHRAILIECPENRWTDLRSLLIKVAWHPCNELPEILPHPGGNPGANLESISHRCYLREVAFEWDLTKETIYLPLGCLQGSSCAADDRAVSHLQGRGH